MNKLQSLTFACAAYILAISLPFVARGQLEATLIQEEGQYPSHTPKYLFANTLEEQEAQLKLGTSVPAGGEWPMTSLPSS